MLPIMNGTLYLADALRRLDTYKRLADRAIAQVEDADLFFTPGSGANSIAVTVKHLAGNMHSRWTDFLTADGEKPDRHRDSEFEIVEADTREALLARWEAGWELAFEAIEPMLRTSIFHQPTNNVVIYAMMAELYVRRGNASRAIACYDAILDRVAPESFEAAFYQGVRCVQTGEREAALRAFLLADRRRPGHAAVRRNIEQLGRAPGEQPPPPPKTAQ